MIPNMNYVIEQHVTAPTSVQMDVQSEKKIVRVSTIQSLEQISLSQPNGTLFLIDIDDTLIDFKYMLGSGAWRRYIMEATKKIDGSWNWHDIFSYPLIQNTSFITTVEPGTSEFVKELQRRGYIVSGFTSRERDQWYDTAIKGVDELTTQQLNALNINFNNKFLENAYSYLALDSEYYKGTFFVNTASKGIYLYNLLETAPKLPKDFKVIFIDDKLSQVQSVAKALTELGIEGECYHYTAIEKKTKAFNPLIANIQLYYFCKSNYTAIPSDQEALEIAKQNPEKDAEYYLREALALYLSKMSGSIVN